MHSIVKTGKITRLTYLKETNTQHSGHIDQRFSKLINNNKEASSNYR